MPDFKPIRNAMIVIAVSKYKDLPDLPGTITSAKRIAKWAKNDSPARNYRVHMITDEDTICENGSVQPGKPVTVDRLKLEIREFLQMGYIDRLIIYFAGHGMAGVTANDFWLLHDAKNDPGEGVKFLSFKTLLEYQNIGANADPEILNKGQLGFIVDACRTSEDFGIDFEGNVLLRKEGPHKTLEVDLYMATTRGDYAFQPNAVDGKDAYCLFSDALSDALEGHIPEVIETQYHPYAPLITSAKLSKWLEEELPRRAKRFGEYLIPDPRPGFVSYNDYYDVLMEPNTKADYGLFADNDVDIDDLIHSSDMGWKTKPLSNASTNKKFSNRRLVRENTDGVVENIDGGATLALLKAKELVTASDIENPNSDDHPLLLFQGRSQLAVPINAHMHFKKNQESVIDWQSSYPLNDQPVFVQNKLANNWTITPVFGRLSTVVLTDFSNEVFLIDPDYSPYPEDPDLSLTRFANKTPQNESDINWLADQMRWGKFRYPNRANKAGYLYYLASDTDNAVRTAHFMAEHHLLSFDLAVIAAARLTWVPRAGGGWTVSADLPAVGGEHNNDFSRPDYTRTKFDARHGVKLTHIFPVFRQGWDILTLKNFDTMPQVMHEIAAKVSGRNVAVLPNHAMEILIGEFYYKTLNFGDSQ